MNWHETDEALYERYLPELIKGVTGIWMVLGEVTPLNELHTKIVYSNAQSIDMHILKKIYSGAIQKAITVWYGESQKHAINSKLDALYIAAIIHHHLHTEIKG